jgi:hypothetical protein
MREIRPFIEVAANVRTVFSRACNSTTDGTPSG